MSPLDVSKSPGKLHWYHWTVIFLSLVLTLGAFYITENQVTLKSSEQFEFQSDQILDLVEERMIKYEEALWAGVSALQMFPGIASRQDWAVFADSLDIDERFPGINGLGVIHYVPPTKLTDYLAWQREAMPDYDIHPPHQVSEYWPITYIVPEAPNARAVGLDMAHETNRYTAAKLARDTGKATVTGPITLVQDSQQTPGFLFYAPWYSEDTRSPYYGEQTNSFNGLVYAPFIMFKLMDGTLRNENRLVNFSIHDGETLLYSEFEETSDNLNLDPDPLYTASKDLELYGRTWTFNLQSTKLFREQQNYAQPFIVLAGGITIDVLLLIIFIVLARTNRNAINYAELVTADLKNRTEELEKLSHKMEIRNKELVEANAELDQFAFVASHDLKAPLRGINQLARWIEEDSEGALNETTKDYLDLMQSRIARLEKLLDDLLVYSRVGRKDGKVETVLLDNMVTDTFYLLNHEQKFTLKSDITNESVETLKTPLEQIIRNLLNNAMKHHDRGQGELQVTIKNNQTYLDISITDDGPGIPEEHQQKVFELFHTLKPRDQVEGSGLGLSIIKKILDRYGCSYELSSEGERGLTFSFTWPINNSITGANHE